MDDLITGWYLRSTLRDEKGQGLIEYGMILVLVSILSITILVIIGQQNVNMFNTVGNAMNT